MIKIILIIDQGEQRAACFGNMADGSLSANWIM